MTDDYLNTVGALGSPAEIALVAEARVEEEPQDVAPSTETARPKGISDASPAAGATSCDSASIYQQRVAYDLTLHELAALLGWPSRKLGDIEHGRTPATAEELLAIRAAMRIQIKRPR